MSMVWPPDVSVLRVYVVMIATVPNIDAPGCVVLDDRKVDKGVA